MLLIQMYTLHILDDKKFFLILCENHFFSKIITHRLKYMR